VATASTWGTQSLFGQHADLHDRLLAELPREHYAVAALMHPNVWYGHGPRQVRAWLGGAMRDGLMLVPPAAPWLSILLAADIVVGDAGSSTAYAAAAGVPVMLAACPSKDVAPGSAAAMLAEAAPRLCPDRPIGPQLADAMAGHRMGLPESVAARITSEPGQFQRNMRRLIYRMLGLTQPASIPVMPPAGMPTVIRRPAVIGRGELPWHGSWSKVSLAFTSPQG
jgi:hypothetical protein